MALKGEKNVRLHRLERLLGRGNHFGTNCREGGGC